MRISVWFAVCIASISFGVASAQDYIFRPGPRGFDPRMNRYGATEAAPGATPTGDGRFNPSKTTVKVEVLMPGEGNALDAQHWSKRFAEFGYSARIRRPLLNDKPEITEQTRGPLRFVTVVGHLDTRGRLVFPGREFTSSDGAELKEWLDELKAYGAQGSPEGQPLWGLSRAQFDAVYSALSKPVTSEVKDLPLTDAIDRLGISEEFPFHFSVAAKEALDAPGQPRGVSRSVAGITAGTALAFLLNEYGMGFRPERLPDGNVQLLIEPLSTTMRDDKAAYVVWPIGWEIEEAPPSSDRRSRPVRDEEAVPSNRQIIGAPLLQQREAIGLANVPFHAALDTVETETGVPLLLDRPAVAALGLDLSKVRVTAPPKNTSWNIVLRSATFPNRLKHDLRRDEAGNPIVVITAIRRSR